MSLYKPYFIVKIEGEELPADEVYSVTLSDSAYSILPELTLILKDIAGKHTSKLDIKLGSLVEVILCDASSEHANETVDSTTFTVYRLYDGEEFKNNMGGFIQVKCKHAWTYFGDDASHAYPPQKISETIKTLCKNAFKPADIKVEDDNFEESTEASTVVRYKCYENELSFISKKLLPYLTVKDSNGLFFIDYKGYAHLSSFNTLFSKSEKALIVPKRIGPGDYKFDKIMQSKGLQTAYYFDDMDIDIGGEAVMDTLKERACIEFSISDQNKTKNVEGIRSLSLFVKDNKVSNTLPIDSIGYSFLNSTSCTTVFNRACSDGISMLINDDEPLNGVLSVNLDFENTILTDVTTGDTVFLHPPYWKNQEEDKKKIIHWATSKWLIVGQTLTMLNAGSPVVSHSLKLYRPTLGYQPETTTIENPERLLNV